MTVSPGESLAPFDRAALEKAVCGALRDSIAVHGPITRETAPMAAKRVIGQVKAMRRQQRGETHLDRDAVQAANRAVDRWLRHGQYAEATVDGERVEIHPGQAAVIAYFEELAQAHAA